MWVRPVRVVERGKRGDCAVGRHSENGSNPAAAATGGRAIEIAVVTLNEVPIGVFRTSSGISIREIPKHFGLYRLRMQRQRAENHQDKAEINASVAGLEFVERDTLRDQMGQAFSELVESVVHTLPLVRCDPT